MINYNAEFEDLLGKTLTKITVNGIEDEMRFHTDDGEIYLLYHSQDCCEEVSIEDIDGDLDNLVYR